MATISSEPSTKLCIANLDDVHGWGWTPLRLAQELNDFRLRSIADLSADCQRDAAQWGTAYFDFPDTWRILITGPEQIVGFWQIIPLTSMAQARFQSGQSTLHKPIEEVFCPMNRPGWYDILVASISVQEQFRTMYSAMLLASSMLKVFTGLARRGIMIREVSAGILTREGMLLNRGLGLDLEYVVSHETAGRVYAGHLPSILRRPIIKESSDVCIKALCELYAAYETEDSAEITEHSLGKGDPC